MSFARIHLLSRNFRPSTTRSLISQTRCLSTETIVSNSGNDLPPGGMLRKPANGSYNVFENVRSSKNSEASSPQTVNPPSPPFPNSSSPSDPPTPTPKPPISRPTRSTQIPRSTSYPYYPKLPSTFGQNQSIKVSSEVLQDLEDVLNHFKAPIRYAFAYGSGVFRQKDYGTQDKPLLDFIFAVSHPTHWHSININQNPHHYSLPMRLLGSGSISWLQEGIGANVWFNIEVEINGKKVKYGVISVDSLRNDLLDWTSLYTAGRMHKPIKILRDDPRIRLDNQVNLASAFRTSLLYLPEKFSEKELYETIASLSYRGDFRMSFAENPNKVANIVATQLDQFRSIYGPFISGGFKRFIQFENSSTPAELPAGPPRMLIQDKSRKARGEIGRKLPEGLRVKVERALGDKVKEEMEGKDAGELWGRITEDERFENILDESIKSIVRGPAIYQGLKGFVSAGPLTSFKYALAKGKKRWLNPPATNSLQSPNSESVKQN